MTTLMILMLLAAARVSSVEHEPQVDYSRYETWSWAKGVTPATNPLTDKRIREAIEAGLSARGFSRADSGGTLLVVYHASKIADIDLASTKTAAAATPTGLQYVEKGSLVVEMLDAASGNVVWRGQVAGVLHFGPREIAGQVQAAVAKLLESFPPPPGRPVP
jgi:hypothetical protein